MGNGGWFCTDWNDVGENVEAGVPAVFALFLREERKSAAFCEYGERRRFCVDWMSARENVEAGVPAVFALFSTKREKRGVLRVWGTAEVLRGLERCGGER